MKCDECNEIPAPITVTVPLAHLEAKDIRYHEMVKRFIVALIIAAALMLAEALAFVWLWNQYDYEETEVACDSELDSNGNIGIINGSNNVVGGND